MSPTDAEVPGGAGTPAPAVAAGVQLPTRYRLIRLLGSGRSGRVWLARDTRTGTAVAVKVIGTGSHSVIGTDAASPRVVHDVPPLDDIVLGRFEREARALARLGDVPGICRVMEVGTDLRGVPWLVMDHLPGGSLADRGRSLTVEHVCRLFTALASAHRLGVLHGDISPSNILFDASGQPNLVDFGMSDVDQRSGAPVPGGMTPAFAAPERVRGGPPTAESDVHALAASLLAHLDRDGNGADRTARILGAAKAPDPARRPTAARVARRLR